MRICRKPSNWVPRRAGAWLTGSWCCRRLKSTVPFMQRGPVACKAMEGGRMVGGAIVVLEPEDSYDGGGLGMFAFRKER